MISDFSLNQGRITMESGCSIPQAGCQGGLGRRLATQGDPLHGAPGGGCVSAEATAALPERSVQNRANGLS